MQVWAVFGKLYSIQGAVFDKLYGIQGVSSKSVLCPSNAVAHY